MTPAEHRQRLTDCQAASLSADHTAAMKHAARDNVVREAVASGMPQAEVARVLGVSFQLVSRIVGRQQ